MITGLQVSINERQPMCPIETNSTHIDVRTKYTMLESSSSVVPNCVRSLNLLSTIQLSKMFDHIRFRHSLASLYD